MRTLQLWFAMCEFLHNICRIFALLPVFLNSKVRLAFSQTVTSTWDSLLHKSHVDGVWHRCATSEKKEIEQLHNELFSRMEISVSIELRVWKDWYVFNLVSRCGFFAGTDVEVNCALLHTSLSFHWVLHFQYRGLFPSCCVGSGATSTSTPNTHTPQRENSPNIGVLCSSRVHAELMCHILLTR